MFTYVYSYTVVIHIDHRNHIGNLLEVAIPLVVLPNLNNTIEINLNHWIRWTNNVKNLFIKHLLSSWPHLVAGFRWNIKFSNEILKVLNCEFSIFAIFWHWAHSKILWNHTYPVKIHFGLFLAYFISIKKCFWQKVNICGRLIDAGMVAKSRARRFDYGFLKFNLVNNF